MPPELFQTFRLPLRLTVEETLLIDRADLEQLLGSRVFLELKVKVRKNWRRDATQIRRFGYGEGA